MNPFLLTNQETERLLFRKLRPADFDTWLPFHQNPKTSEFWSGLPKDAVTACQQDFDRTFYRYDNNLGGKQALFFKETNTLVGLCGLLVQNVGGKQEIEIAYSLLPTYWKNGFAIEAAQKCKRFAIENALTNSLISIIHVDNLRSQKVALSNGMQLDKTTTYHDNPVHIYRISI